MANNDLVQTLLSKFENLQLQLQQQQEQLRREQEEKERQQRLREAQLRHELEEKEEQRLQRDEARAAQLRQEQLQRDLQLRQQLQQHHEQIENALLEAHRSSTSECVFSSRLFLQHKILIFNPPHNYPPHKGDSQVIDAWVRQLLEAPKGEPPLPVIPNLELYVRHLWANLVVKMAATSKQPQELMNVDENTVVLPFVRNFVASLTQTLATENDFPPSLRKAVVDHHKHRLIGTDIEPDLVLVAGPQVGSASAPLTVNGSLFFIECKRSGTLTWKDNVLQYRKYLQHKAADKSPAFVFVTDGVYVRLYWMTVEARKISESGGAGPALAAAFGHYGQTELLRLATSDGDVAMADGAPPNGLRLLMHALLTSSSFFLNPPAAELVQRVTITIAPSLSLSRPPSTIRRGANGHATVINIHTNDGQDYAAKLYESNVEYAREVQALTVASNSAVPRLVASNADMLCIVVAPLAPNTLAYSRFSLGLFNAARGAAVQVLSVLHANGLVHRDVKPSNILVVNEDCCLLNDFGQCVVTPAHVEEHYGTVGFRSIRSLTKPHKPVDDWISLAVTLQWFASQRHHSTGVQSVFYDEVEDWISGMLPLLIKANRQRSTDEDCARLKEYLGRVAVDSGSGESSAAGVGTAVAAAAAAATSVLHPVVEEEERGDDEME